MMFKPAQGFWWGSTAAGALATTNCDGFTTSASGVTGVVATASNYFSAPTANLCQYVYAVLCAAF